MGLSIGFLDDLIALKRAGALDGVKRVAEIGSQQLADSLLMSDARLDELYGLFGAPRVDLGSPCGEANFTRKAPPSRPFWMSLGFELTAIDFDGHRDSVALDLNTGEVPGQLRGAFDLVVNVGTSEHIANQSNCFRVMHELVRKGGLMHHEVPVFLLGHGLFNYSPKFFLQLMRENDYQPVMLRTQFERAGLPARRSPVPSFIHAMNRKWGLGAKLEVDALPDLSITAVLRKLHDQDFYLPLDLPRAYMVKRYLRRPRSLKHLVPLR
jgi:hypothetical protein